MERFKRSLSIRKKKESTPESSKPHQWQEDERKVREGNCSFQVKYLGCIEVFESRGIQVCEEAVKALKSRKSRSVWSRLSMRKKKKDDNQQNKSGHHRAILYVTGDALRVVDEISKGLIVDQTIEKVSFCAPDRNQEKGFAYICRDGTTRRWMCHGFLAVKESGERLSHAVGCAFAICLEKKQQREKEKVSVTYNDNGTSFTRMGSFRQTTMTERLADPQSAILADPVPLKQASNPYAVQRPHAPVDLLERQGSFRSFNKLAESSPFKRNISLRLNELPSTLDRHRQFGLDGPQLAGVNGGNGSVISTILEGEELDDLGSQPPMDSFAAMTMNNGMNQQMTSQGNGAFNHQLPLPNTHQPQHHMNPTLNSIPHQVHTSAILTTASTNPVPNVPTVASNPSRNPAATTQMNQTISINPPQREAGNQSNPLRIAVNQPIPLNQSNPWASKPPVTSAGGKSSDAEAWLNTTANIIDPFAGVPHSSLASRQRSVNGVSHSPHEPFTSANNTAPTHQPQQMVTTGNHQQQMATTGNHQQQMVTTGNHQMVTTGNLLHHIVPLGSHQMATTHYQQQTAVHQTAFHPVPASHHQMSFPGGDQIQHHGQVTSVAPASLIDFNQHPAPISRGPVFQSHAAITTGDDPFDLSWAAKSAAARNTNPFQPVEQGATPAFQLKI